MTPLWLAALVLLLLALSCLLVPLLAGAGNADAAEDERLRQLHALRLAEVERDLQAAALGPEDGARALEDTQRLVLEDMQRSARPRRDARWLRWAPAGALTVLLPLAAAVLYLQVGDPQAANHQRMAARGGLPHGGDDEAAVAAMVTRLAQRLQEQPDDAEGWMMLARSYEVLERHEAAAAAYRKARALVQAQAEPAPARALAGQVLLAPALQGRVRAGDTLFIVARAADAGRMPVAALRVQLAGLPLAFTLDDRHAMAPELALSRFPAASIEARISRSGSASRQPGDLFGTVPEAALGRTDLRIVIDQVVR